MGYLKFAAKVLVVMAIANQVPQIAGITNGGNKFFK